MSGLLRCLLIIILSCLVLASSCVRSLKAPMALDPALQEMCDDYLRLNPDDPFLEQIKAQKLTKGMNPTQVFLSWGRPLYREKSGDSQRWLYEFDVEQLMLPKRVAELFFEKGSLHDWRLKRGFVFYIDPDRHDESVPPCVDIPSKGP